MKKLLFKHKLQKIIKIKNTGQIAIEILKFSIED